MIQLIYIFNSDNPGSKKLTTEIVIPVLSSPELVFIGYENKQRNLYHLTFPLSVSNFSAAKPEQIGADASDNKLGKSKSHNLDIIHTYTLYNKGPSDAKRTEIKLMWPMLPLSGYNEQTPFLYGIELPTIIRSSEPKANNDRCFIYQPVRLRYDRII